MLRAGERVGVGVSGGADSVALLLLLVELRDELGIVLSVAHMNHKLRGAASDADEKFVAKLAEKHGLTVYSESVDVAAKARGEKANLEDAARRTRYELFARLVAEGKVERVAVAHTADDQAETVLAHILRGTGLAGLGGIHPRTECVVRPVLGFRRAELREYLRAKKQKWREDATNRDMSRTRARIRKKLLPLLEKEFQSGVVEHLGSLADFAQEDERFLEWVAVERCNGSAKKEVGAVRIAIGDLLSPMGKVDFNAEGTENTEKNENECAALTKRMLFRLIEERKRGDGQISADAYRGGDWTWRGMERTGKCCNCRAAWKYAENARSWFFARDRKAAPAANAGRTSLAAKESLEARAECAAELPENSWRNNLAQRNTSTKSILEMGDRNCACRKRGASSASG